MKTTTRTSAKTNSPITKTIQLIMERAVKAGASDVHIEPRSGYGVVRQRINGMLQATTRLPGTSYGAVVSQLKKMALLDIGKKTSPQSGSYSATIGRRPYEVSVSTLPVLDGERVALHIADVAREPVSLSELGYWGEALELINNSLTQPHGLVLVSGSEQTSTLLTLSSMLQTISSPHLQLASVEQALNYNLPNVDQTLVKREIGMTFARRLKQVLSKEPNVVMVSEVRDPQTARGILQAVANRQLILAGVSAPNAVSAIAGFGQLSDERMTMSTSLLLTVSQKPVSQLCHDCCEAYTPDNELITRLNKIFGIDNARRMQRVHELELGAINEQVGVLASKPQSIQPNTSEQRILRLWRAHDSGCKTCSHTGYFGRLTINEVVPKNSALQSAINSSASINGIGKAAQGEMIPLAQDALIKALRGLITIESVFASVM